MTTIEFRVSIQIYFRDPQPPYESERDNCELSDRDTRDLEIANPQFFEQTGNYDFYERSLDRQSVDGDCLDGKCKRFLCRLLHT